MSILVTKDLYLLLLFFTSVLLFHFDLLHLKRTQPISRRTRALLISPFPYSRPVLLSFSLCVCLPLASSSSSPLLRQHHSTRTPLFNYCVSIFLLIFVVKDVAASCAWLHLGCLQISYGKCTSDVSSLWQTAAYCEKA